MPLITFHSTTLFLVEQTRAEKTHKQSNGMQIRLVAVFGYCHQTLYLYQWHPIETLELTIDYSCYSYSVALNISGDEDCLQKRAERIVPLQAGISKEKARLDRFCPCRVI